MLGVTIISHAPDTSFRKPRASFWLGLMAERKVGQSVVDDGSVGGMVELSL